MKYFKRFILFFNNRKLFNQFHKQISIWEKFNSDWDGQAGIPLSKLVATNARDFVNRMKRKRIPVPLIYVAGDGEIGFRWRSEKTKAAIAFLDDGSVVGYCSGANKLKSIKVDDVYFPHRKHPEIMEMLDAIKIHFG